MTRILTIVLLLVSTPLVVLHGQSGIVQWHIEKNGSKLWIDGSSTVNTFACMTFRLNGEAMTSREHVAATASAMKPHVKVSILVRTLDCGSGMMNKDMYEAMKEAKNPEILYELVSAWEALEPDTVSGWISAESTGKLTIAGALRIVKFPLKIMRLSESRVRIVGKLPLLMSDFGITPPTAFFGLIRSNDELTVNFDLVARTVGDSGASLAKDGYNVKSSLHLLPSKRTRAYFCR